MRFNTKGIGRSKIKPHERIRAGAGDSSLRTFTKKRYRYVGKEKDLESGLYYYGARYYAAWTCRFISIDPLAHDYPFYTPYNYAGNKPINKIDIDGMQEEGAAAKPQSGTEGNTAKGTENSEQNHDPAVVKEMEQKMHALDEKYNTNGEEDFTIKGEIQTQNGESRYEINVLDKNNLVVESTRNFSNESTQYNSVEGVNDLKIVQPDSNSSEKQNSNESYSDKTENTTAILSNASEIVKSAAEDAEKVASGQTPTRYKAPENLKANPKSYGKIAKGAKILGYLSLSIEFGSHALDAINHYQKDEVDEVAESSIKAVGSVGAFLLAAKTGALVGTAIGGPIGAAVGFLAGIAVGLAWSWVSGWDWW